jgi:DNA end-binding protein Ku
VRPDGKVGQDAFAVIRETNRVAIGRVIIAIEPVEKGLIGTLLRYPYEVRSEEEYFDEIQDVKVTKDMHIVNQKPGLFLPEKFDDQYETALIDLIGQKRSGQPITKKDRPAGGNVVDLMEALRRNVGGAEPAKASKASKKARKAASGQKEMLTPIEGKRPKRRRRRSRRPSREGSRPSHSARPAGSSFIQRGFT